MNRQTLPFAVASTLLLSGTSDCEPANQLQMQKSISYGVNLPEPSFALSQRTPMGLNPDRTAGTIFHRPRRCVSSSIEWVTPQCGFAAGAAQSSVSPDLRCGLHVLLEIRSGIRTFNMPASFSIVSSVMFRWPRSISQTNVVASGDITGGMIERWTAAMVDSHCAMGGIAAPDLPPGRRRIATRMSKITHENVASDLKHFQSIGRTLVGLYADQFPCGTGSAYSFTKSSMSLLILCP